MVKHLTVWPALAALALLGGGCRKNTASIQAYQICSMPDDCTFSGKCDAGFLGTPAIDVAGGVAMWLAVEMHNQLADNANEESGQVNTHDAHFESYTLEFSGARPGLLPASIANVPASGGYAQQIIPAGSTAVIGFEPFPIQLIADLQGAVPSGPDYDEVTVTATFKGRYEDGTKWETELDFPVRICQDCIFPVCSDATQVPIGACPSLHQEPHGAPSCTKPEVTCAGVGTFCGSNPNVMFGDANTLYVCGTAGAPPANSTTCANGCNASVTPNVCNP